MTKRIDEYDIAKGIGIILVVIGHTITNVKVVQFIYSFHMPLFFILSGLVMKEKKNFQSIKDIFISEKILFVDYFFWSFFGFVF